MKVSFCITCKNRFHQIIKTLPKNLIDNNLSQQIVDFVLVDFDSTDGLGSWVVNNFQNELESGYLKYYHTTAMQNWQCSIAKNTSHYLATGDIVVNLDCDNYTGENGGQFVIDEFCKEANIVLHQSRINPGDGSFGRIAVMKHYFNLIGGYDEALNPMGYQDVDLILRLLKLGLMYAPKPDLRFNNAIHNTKAEGIRYTKGEKTYDDMLLENKEASRTNIKFSKILANDGIYGIRNGVFQFKDALLKSIN